MNHWEGIEVGWPYSYTDGAGKLGLVRGTIDGTPLDNMFPYAPTAGTDGIKHSYATEGWAVSNRAWMSTIIFSTLGSTEIKIFDNKMENEVTKPQVGDIIIIQLKAALNLDWNKKEAAWINVQIDDNKSYKIPINETDKNSGVFTGELKLNFPSKSRVKISYGYMGFEKKVELTML